MKGIKPFKRKPIFSNSSIHNLRTTNTQSMASALPWETRVGVLWGFPATIWMLIRHPLTSFSARPQAGLVRAWLFLSILYFCVSVFVLLAFYAGLYLHPSVAPIANQIEEGGFIVLLNFIAPEIVLSPISALIHVVLMYLPLAVVIQVCAGNTIDHNSIIRLLFYCDVSNIILVLPLDVSLIRLLWTSVLIYYGIIATYNIGKIRTLTCIFLFTISYMVFHHYLRRLPDPLNAWIF